MSHVGLEIIDIETVEQLVLDWVAVKAMEKAMVDVMKDVNKVVKADPHSIASFEIVKSINMLQLSVIELNKTKVEKKWSDEIALMDEDVDEQTVNKFHAVIDMCEHVKETRKHWDWGITSIVRKLETFAADISDFTADSLGELILMYEPEFYEERDHFRANTLTLVIDYNRELSEHLANE